MRRLALAVALLAMRQASAGGLPLPPLPAKPDAERRADSRASASGVGGATARFLAVASVPDLDRGSPHPARAIARVRPPLRFAGGGEGDGIPASLTGEPGDPARGRAIVANRTKGLCLLCHSAPIPEERFQGDLAPSLAGAGSRWSAPQLRLRVAAPQCLNAETIMPPYLGEEGLVRVGAAFQGKPILTRAEIEDVVAYLATLKEP